MAADDHRPYRGGTAQAEPPPGHPGQGPPVSPPVRPVNRTWWVLPFAGGALAVIVAAAAVTAVLHTPRMSRQDSAASSAESSSGAAKGPPMPSQMFPDARARRAPRPRGPSPIGTICGLLCRPGPAAAGETGEPPPGQGVTVLAPG